MGRHDLPSDTSKLLSYLIPNTKLTHLKLCGLPFDEKTAATVGNWLKSNSTLKTLCLEKTGGHLQPILDAMEFNKTLEELDLDGSCDMSTVSFEPLKKNKKLVTLKIGGNAMDAAACKKIAPFINFHPSIKVIDMTGFAIHGDGLKIIGGAIAGVATIRSLSLDGNYSVLRNIPGASI